jgi:hypothetical protein
VRDYTVTTGVTTRDHTVINAASQLFFALQTALFQGLVDYRIHSTK